VTSKGYQSEGVGWDVHGVAVPVTVGNRVPSPA
jgi:hypothetical protein